MTTEKRPTAGQVMERFRQMPEMRKLVEDCYYDEDLVRAAKRFYDSEEFSAVKEYLHQSNTAEPGVVLDLGGGNGVASLACQWAGWRAVLAEPDYSDVVGLGAIATILKQTAYDVSPCAALGERLPFGNGTFDVVYTRQVLHHVPDLEAVCGEVFRVLKPKGMYIATREHVISKQSDLDIFLQNHPVHRLAGGENAHLLREYRTALRRAGFRKIKVFGPWQSVINYYPTTCSQYVDLCRAGLSRYLGPSIARYLVSLGFVLKLAGWYATRNDDTPGRMYSFIAMR
jgi:SAM-dependent methyltransferase